MTGYDLALRDPAVAAGLRPDAVLRVGAAPTSASLLSWLERHADVPQIVIDAGRRWKDHQAVAHQVAAACPVDTLERLDALLERRTDPHWRDAWTRIDVAARAAALDGEPHEGTLAAAVMGAVPPGTPVFVSSSMPVRDLDAYGGGRPDEVPVWGNRGASGIDGIVSTALGVAAGTGRTAVALVGDLAFLHDVNGLLAAREPDVRVVIVLVNNDGGGIFHMLPVRESEPAFTPFFATPHGADLARASALYGVEHRRIGADALGVAVAEAVSGTGPSVVLEVITDRDDNRRGHEASAKRAAEAARAALGG